MTLRDKLRKLKTEIGYRIFPSSARLPDPEPRTTWEALTSPLSGISGIRDAIRELSQLYTRSDQRQGEELFGQIEALFGGIGQVFDNYHIPSQIRNIIEGLAKELRDEAEFIRSRQDRPRRNIPGTDIAQLDEDIEASRLRINHSLRRAILNMNMAMWLIMRDLVMDNQISRLAPSLSACYNSAQAITLKRGPCTPGTRIQVLDNIVTWAHNDRNVPYWMNGMAGTGKTAIAYSLCESLDARNQLAASFFCSRLIPECRDVNRIVPSIAYQLALYSPPFRVALSGVLEQDPSAHTRLPRLQFDALISQPLLKVEGQLPDNLIVVIDALDECEEKEGTSQILEVLVNKASSLPVKFFISSRPEPQILGPIGEHHDMMRYVLHDLDHGSVLRDIEVYFRTELASVMPTENQIAALVKQAGVLFIYAAVVVRHINYGKFGKRGSRARLIHVSEAPNPLEAIYRETDNLYTNILQEALGNPRLDDSDRDHIRQILHTVVHAQEPLSAHTLSVLSNVNDIDRIGDVLGSLRSVLHVWEPSGLITTLHSSFPEFMRDSSRSRQYHYGPKATSLGMTQYCFDIFRDTKPQFNICGLNSSYIPDHRIYGLEERLQSAIPDELFYASRFWATHLQLSSGSPEILQMLEEFLSSQLLLWMEVMNLKHCAGLMPQAMRLVEEWTESSTECSANLKALIYDARKFVTAFALGSVSASTPHIYTSMLPFWPESSPITERYAQRVQGAIQFDGGALGQRQDALLAIWHFDDTTRSPNYSPDGKHIAVGIGNEIWLLDTSTGQPVQDPMWGHSEVVILIQFSTDGGQIASMSLDGTVIKWDAKTGAIIFGPLRIDLGTFKSAAFSPNSTRVATGSQDETVCVWDCDNGECLLGPLTWNHGAIMQVKYSRNGLCVATCSLGGISWWDAQNGNLLRNFLPSNSDVSFCSVDISPDCAHIASGSTDNTVYIWDTNSGQVITGPLKPSDTSYNPFLLVLFSPDGSHLFSSSQGGTICVWDTRTGHSLCDPLEGHTDNITSLSCSPDGAYVISGSYDMSLHLWDVRNKKERLDSLNGHSGSVTSVGFSPNGRRIVSGSNDQTTRVWGAENGQLVLGPFRKNCSDRILNAYSPDGTCIISNTQDGLVLLDSQSGHIALGPIQFNQVIQSAVFSPDGSRIILALATNSIRVLAAGTGQTILDISPTLTNQSNWAHMTSIATSPDGACITVGSMHSIFSTFDASSGRLILGPLDGHNNSSRSLAYSPDGTRIASSSFSVSVRDAESGELVYDRPEGHTGRVNSVEFSRDGAHIVSGGTDNAICVWDALNGRPLLGPFKWHTGPVMSVRFSPDGSRVVSGSDDRTIRVTDVGPRTQPFPASLSPTGSDWYLNEDGWVMDTQDRLLAWVPPDLRTVLMYPRTTLLISRRGSLRLNFSDSKLGDDWANCYKPSR